MNFRVCTNHAMNPTPLGKVVHCADGIQIESDYQKIIIHENLTGTLFCLGSVSSRDNSELVSTHFDKVDNLSFQHIISKLEGRFILIFVGNDSLCIGSDQFGKLDIYYQHSKSAITLASNLELLPEDLAADGFNQVALAHMLTYYGYRPSKKETLYNSVKRLGVDECAYIMNGDKLTLKKRVFVAQKTQNYTDTSHDEYADIFLDHLKEVGSEDGNIIYLSSGWDSTSILAGLIHLFGNEKITGIIGKMKFSKRSGCCNQIEIDKAKKFADYYDIKLEVIDWDLTTKDKNYFESLKDRMRKYQLYALTGYTHDKLAIKASDLAKKNETIFAGEISDGVHNMGFSQYTTIFHPSSGFREYSDKMASYLFGPTFLSLLLNGDYIKDPVYKLFKDRIGAVDFDEVAKTPNEIKLQLLTSMFLRDARLPLWSLENEAIFTAKGRKYYTQEMQEKYLIDIAKNMNIDNIYANYLYLYNSFHWQGSSVLSVQTMSDYYALNSDMPFWSSDLQDFLSKMPEYWGRGLDLNPTKYPLKQMLKGGRIDYPYDYQDGNHSYTYDVDHSFSHAQEVYCYSALVEDFQNSVRHKPYHQILSKDYFDLDYIDGLIDEYISSPTDMTVANVTKMVPIIMLCYVGWYGKY